MECGHSLLVRPLEFTAEAGHGFEMEGAGDLDGSLALASQRQRPVQAHLVEPLLDRLPEGLADQPLEGPWMQPGPAGKPGH